MASATLQKTPAMPPFMRQIKAARRVSVPLLAIATPDPAATIDQIIEATKGETKDETPILVWDVMSGVTTRTESGREPASRMRGEADDQTVGNPSHLLRLAADLPEHAILFVQMSPRWM